MTSRFYTLLAESIPRPQFDLSRKLISEEAKRLLNPSEEEVQVGDPDLDGIINQQENAI